MSRFRPERLFEPWRRHVPKRRDADEFDAIRAGVKMMSISGFERRDLARPHFAAFVSRAVERGLTVVLVPDRAGHIELVDAYVVRREQVWRVSALRTLKTTAYKDGPWTHAATRQQRTLLGDTPAQIEAQLRSDRWRSAAYGCRPATYVLLAPEQRARVVALAQRCLGTAAELVGMRVFSDWYGRLRRDAFSRVPGGLTLARFGLAHDVAEDVVPTVRRYVLCHGTIAAADAERFAAGITTRIELLGRRGWA